MSWQLSLILNSWASVQRQPLLSPGILYTLLVLLVGNLDGHLCLSIRCSLQRLCPYWSQPHSALMSLSLMGPDLQYSLSFLPQSFHQDPIVALVGLEGELAGSFPHCSKLGPASSTNLGVSSSPCTELCSLLTLTSWEPTRVLLSWWSLSELLGEWSHFLGLGLAMGPGNGHPTDRVPAKGISGRRGTKEGGVPVGLAGLLEGPRASDPSSSGTVVVVGTFSSCCLVANTLFIKQKGTVKETHQGSSLIESV